MIKFADSFGDVEMRITYLATQTDVPEECRERNGITESMLRISVGIEDVMDLLEKLEKVFDEAAKE